jgi:4-azaleucine resistance transporter AzlC
MPDHSIHSDVESVSIGEEQVSFDAQGVLDGARKSIPIAISVFAYGLVFGVLARQADLSLLEALLMSGLVFAGASQFVALGLWAMPLPVGAIILTTLIVNLRHLLMGASVSPWFSRLPFVRAYGTLFFLSDESWALLMGEFASGKRNAAFLLGSGGTVYLAWVGAALVGGTLGGVIQDPAQWGLDFAITAVFIALLVGLWRGKKDLLPWIVAAIVATAAAHWLPGKWYILLGALTGSLIGVVRYAD